MQLHRVYITGDTFNGLYQLNLVEPLNPGPWRFAVESLVTSASVAPCGVEIVGTSCGFDNLTGGVADTVTLFTGSAFFAPVSKDTVGIKVRDVSMFKKMVQILFRGLDGNVLTGAIRWRMCLVVWLPDDD